MKLIIGLFALVAASSVFAADTSSGCGMGYEVAPKQSLVSSSTRSLVNATFSNSIAMTLGTSGCAKHSIVKNDAKGIHFAEANMNQLAVEMSRGNGEFVAGFAGVFGCQNAEAFGSMVQAKYESVLPSANTSGVELYNNVKAEIRNNATLSASCSLI
ncbi:DUF3015 domain-containing protein [Bacteriovorax stolpii]|uniref:Uncharacterized protein n=1 Tax=Bacteriovorax stolpii TaxID=960 RepID=A0A2K9NP61_BACTC|nr:DUF3015 family protein [Bacteriovorax stolpii]AUN97288.1 hypothetical protein C0V70_04010 [Bacteriovorax stolpii]QDK42774.1 DUF3015 domain-containing protein [Bacteriovorax stolpii]TDP52459.1 hypothetical protein C8D79_2223 [Bacteriovorax stolpii]BDT27374.1 DUF3015 family protein [Bacteriovorax sp. HI3]